MANSALGLWLHGEAERASLGSMTLLGDGALVATSVGFWSAHAHPLLLLFGLAVFPRLTTLFVGGPFGLLHWLGWLFAPHLLVAVLATARYWDTDPLLCVVAWFFAFAGTGGEGKATQRVVVVRRRRDRRDGG